jgi:signal transduction histidine kinase
MEARAGLTMMAAMSVSQVLPRNWARRLSYGGVVILVLIEVTTVQRTHPTDGSLIETTVATAVAAAAWLFLTEWNPPPGATLGQVLLILLGAASIALAIVSPQGAHIISAIVALAVAARLLEGRLGTGYAIVFIASYLAVTAYSIGFQLVALLSYGLGLTFAFLASRSVARLRDEQRHTQALLLELQASRDAQVQSAALNERTRIAREIHDVLAHTLAALAVQLEGARLMLDQRHTDPEALASVERAHRLAKEGLEETRRAVSALRGDRIPGPAGLAQLVKDFQRDSEVAAELQIDGDVHQLPSEVQLALYRTAQEALTNVRKHASAKRVRVVLRYQPNGTELQVVDAGPQRPDSGPASSGYGLLGMRERAELLGGTLEAGPAEAGFRVRLWIPR